MLPPTALIIGGGLVSPRGLWACHVHRCYCYKSSKLFLFPQVQRKTRQKHLMLLDLTEKVGHCDSTAAPLPRFNPPLLLWSGEKKSVPPFAVPCAPRVILLVFVWKSAFRYVSGMEELAVTCRVPPSFVRPRGHYKNAY